MNIIWTDKLAESINDFQKEFDRAENTDSCVVYKRVKPSLDKVIRLITIIPYGAEISILIKSLSELLDGLCDEL